MSSKDPKPSPQSDGMSTSASPESPATLKSPMAKRPSSRSAPDDDEASKVATRNAGRMPPPPPRAPATNRSSIEPSRTADTLSPVLTVNGRLRPRQAEPSAPGKPPKPSHRCEPTPSQASQPVCTTPLTQPTELGAAQQVNAEAEMIETSGTLLFPASPCLSASVASFGSEPNLTGLPSQPHASGSLEPQSQVRI